MQDEKAKKGGKQEEKPSLDLPSGYKAMSLVQKQKYKPMAAKNKVRYEHKVETIGKRVRMSSVGPSGKKVKRDPEAPKQPPAALMMRMQDEKAKKGGKQEGKPSLDSTRGYKAEDSELSVATPDVDIQAKRSFVQGIYYTGRAWRLRCRKNSKDGAPFHKDFSTAVHTKPGMSADEGCLEAFNAAKAERQKKVDSGLMKPHDTKKHKDHMRSAAMQKKVGRGRRALFEGKALPKSRVVGICWGKVRCSWKVQLYIRHKRMTSGTFAPLNALPQEIEKAHLEALACLQEARRAYGLPEAVECHGA